MRRGACKPPYGFSPCYAQPRPALAAYVTHRPTWQPLARQSLQHPFARGNAAQVRVAHFREYVTRLGAKRRSRLLEALHRPPEPAHEVLDARACALHRDCLVVELAGGGCTACPTFPAAC